MEIASHLDRNDLCRLVNVNSHFRAVVRKYAASWAYEHGTVSALGSLRFPLAPTPYQFWRKLPNADEEDASMPDEDRAAAVARVKRIDIKPHPTVDCSDFAKGELGSITWESPPCYRLNLRVLHVQFYFPQQPSKHNDPRHLYHTDTREDEHVCLYFKSLPAPHKIRRIVMKDIPRISCLPDPWDEYEHEFDGEFVSVLYSQNSRPPLTQRSACKFSHELGLHMPGLLGISWTAEVVIVFWTGQPGQVWIPPC